MSNKKTGRRKSRGKRKNNSDPTIVNKGDFILIDYIGEVRDTGEIFDTTLEDKAKEAGIYRENDRYGPTLVIVGENWVIEGLDESLVGRREGEEFTVEIPPEKGFGTRDSKKIITTTIKKLRRAGYEGDISPGTIINVEGRPAIIRAVAGGRVMLDFNPPLAGKVLKYWVKIEKILKDREEKIKSLIERHVGEKVSDLAFSEKDGEVIIELNDIAINDPRIHLEKRNIGEDIIKYVEGVKVVTFVDRIVKKETSEEISQGEPQQE